MRLTGTLLDEAREKSAQITSPQDAIEAWCMISAWLMQQDGYAHTNDCFCGERAEWVSKGVWACEGSSIRAVIDLLQQRDHQHRVEDQ